ncbi:MAG: hypothetical protein H6527_09330 [Actinobacteria bacterium]|nr:hypothetical protein [Actinomycetota bacterium]
MPAIECDAASVTVPGWNEVIGAGKVKVAVQSVTVGLPVAVTVNVPEYVPAAG